MKKLTDFTKKELIISSLVVSFVILSTIIGLFIYFFDSELAANQAKVFDELNNNEIIKEEIGYISRFADSSYEILEKHEDNGIEYILMIARGGKSRYAKIEYWVNKQDSVWFVDSINVIKTSDNRIRN